MAHYIPKNTQRRGDKHSRIVVFNPNGTKKHMLSLWALLAKAQEKDEDTRVQASVS